MGITYTPKLHLGKQLDKSDYLNWDVLTANWDKLDDAAFVGENSPLRVMPLLNAPFTSGSVETVTQEET